MVELPTNDYAGRLIITWPKAASHPVVGHGVVLTDADSGTQVTTATDADILIHADPQHVVTATMTMLIGEDGKPLATGAPMVLDEDRENVRTDTFRWLVAEMRVAP